MKHDIEQLIAEYRERLEALAAKREKRLRRKAEKIKRVQAMRDQGMTLAAIGAKLGVTRQRVHQMLQREKD